MAKTRDAYCGGTTGNQSEMSIRSVSTNQSRVMDKINHRPAQAVRVGTGSMTPAETESSSLTVVRLSDQSQLTWFLEREWLVM